MSIIMNACQSSAPAFEPELSPENITFLTAEGFVWNKFLGGSYYFDTVDNGGRIVIAWVEPKGVMCCTIQNPGVKIQDISDNCKYKKRFSREEFDEAYKGLIDFISNCK